MPDIRCRRFSGLGKPCLLILLSAVFLESGNAPAAEPSPGGEFVNRVYRDEHGEHKYAVFVPAGYTADREWPVILWLHGASSRGKDGRSTLVAGIGPNVHFRRATFPFLVVFPQCENLRSRLLGGWTDEREDADRALKILDAAEQEFRVDPRRRTLAGVSMGAFGVWSIAARTPDHWSALVPVSGGGTPEMAMTLAKVPVWAFHAVDDQVVAMAASTSLVSVINDHGGRAFFNELPNGGHNISSRVFAQDDVYTWLLDPSREPQQKLTWPLDARTTSNLQDEVPFVPGAEVDDAVLVHLGKHVFEALSLALPKQVPADSLQASLGGQSESTGDGLFRFQVNVAGVQYTGQVRQARLEPLPDNQLRIQIGIQPLTMTVLGTEVQGRILRAEAGPMQVVIGSQRPSWLSFVVKPRVAERQLRLDLVSADFSIEQDNWYVTEPAGVSVRPVPFLRGTISQRLTDGLYAKKGEIEQRVVASVPRLLEQIEQRVAAQLQRTITFGRWPMPVWQPRARFWLSGVTVDQNGLTISLGTTLAALAPTVDQVTLRRHTGVAKKPAFASPGVEVLLANSVVTAWSELLAASEVRFFHAADFHIEPFQRLGDREFLEQAIPALATRYADSELQSVISFEQPMRMALLDHPQTTDEASSKSGADAPSSAFQLSVPELRLTVSTRPAPGNPWTPVAEFSMSWVQDFALNLQTPGHRLRTLNLSSPKPAVVEVEKREVLRGSINQARTDAIAEQFRLGMQDTVKALVARGTSLREHKLGEAPFLVDQIGWRDDYLTIHLDVATLQLRNRSSEPLAYEVGTQGGSWSQTYTLPTGMMHEFPALRPLTWRSKQDDRELRYTLPVGAVVLYRGGEEPVVLATEEPLDPQATLPGIFSQ